MFSRTLKVRNILMRPSTPIINRAMSSINELAFVNGKWISAKSKKTFPVYNPADCQVIGHVPEMDANDTREAIDAAHDAFKSFRNTTAKERSDLLRSWYNLLVKHSEDLASILTKENGKALNESRAEVRYGNSFIEWYSEEARRVSGEVLQAPVRNRELLLLKQPIGVAGFITPWNFPQAMIARKAGPALAAGCTCVIKPAGDTPFSALAMAELAEKAGFPPGTINVITSSVTNSVEVGQEICSNPKVRVLSFTGSTQVGKLLYKQCAPTMKRLGLELGGNAPFIVFNSADVDLAVSGAMASKFRNCGQTCVSANRFFVQDGVFDKFTEKFLERINSEIKLGDGLKEGITHGPLINKSQMEIVKTLVEDAVKKGAKLHCGGKALENLGPLFYAPTLLTDVTKEMDIYKREIFGPVAVIHKFKNEEDALREANDINVGLAGYFYSGDISQAFRVARNMEVGMVGVNEGLISCTEAAFGGVKESGLGREGSSHGMDEYLDIKYVCVGNVEH